MKVKLCAVQFKPEWGERQRNIRTATRLLRNTQPHEYDFIVLPEMAFTGYVFNSFSEIRPYLEDKHGPTFQFCKEVAMRLNCWVVAGYPEISFEEDESKNGKRDGEQGKAYNSMCVVDEHGQLVLNYRKTLLYETDKKWACKGDGFQTIRWKEINIGFGICMDLNVEDFDFSKDDFPLSKFCSQNDVSLLIVSTAWLQSESDDGLKELFEYWLWRLKPLWNETCVFLAANRTGSERGVTFAGGSVCIDLKQMGLVNWLDQEEDGLLSASVEIEVPTQQVRKKELVAA
mmetsp:Transcript_15257/g.26657  ORF Transcript_15257/g.26657 Transcript_15257/m.26657 type:complete len:287 (-) Transcript_15257:1090-1950(-)